MIEMNFRQVYAVKSKDFHNVSFNKSRIAKE